MFLKHGYTKASVPLIFNDSEIQKFIALYMTRNKLFNKPAFKQWLISKIRCFGIMDLEKEFKEESKNVNMEQAKILLDKFFIRNRNE